MEPIDFLRALRRRWYIVVAAVLVSLAAAWVTTPAQAEQRGPSVAYYQATASLLQVPGAEVPLSYVQIFVTRGEVPELVAEEVGYDGDPAILASQITAIVDAETGILSISTTDEDPARAVTLANSFAQTTLETIDSLARENQRDEVRELQGQLRETQAALDEATANVQDRPNDPVAQARQSVLSQQYSAILAQLYVALDATTGSAQVEILQEATAIPVVSGGFQPPSSRTGRMLLAGGVGLVLGILLALIVARLDTRLRTRDDIERAFELPVVAEVPKVSLRMRRSHAVAAVTSPISAQVTAYRSLRSSLTLMPSRRLTPPGTSTRDMSTGASGDPKVILITSCRPGEGKSTTAANLAVTLAETGKHVMLIDTDFRNPSMNRLMDVGEGPGLGEILANGSTDEISSLARPTAVEGVRVLTTGDTQDYRGALPSRIQAVIEATRRLADVIVIDAAPLLAGNDAMDFMPFVDTCVVVCRSSRVTGEQAQRAHALLMRVGVPVLGVVVIGSQTPHGHPHGLSGYGYGYGSGRHGSSEGRRRRKKSSVSAETR